MNRRCFLVACPSLVLAGCARLSAPPTLPVGHSTVFDQLVIYSDFPLPRQHRLFDELVALRGHVADTLDLPPGEEPIHVYLFKNEHRYKAFMLKHYPDFPQRRAFFVETDTRLEVYAHWGDRVAEDMRHEVSHGYLHAVVPNLPLWLDEGLAEYFETPRGAGGFHRQHARHLAEQVAAGWRPDVKRLGRLTSVPELTQLDYAESWAWVHYLLHHEPAGRKLLADHLQSLRTTRRARPLSARLRELRFDPDRTLLEYIRSFKLSDETDESKEK